MPRLANVQQAPKIASLILNSLHQSFQQLLSKTFGRFHEHIFVKVQSCHLKFLWGKLNLLNLPNDLKYS